MGRLTIGVVVFPGSNCDHDAYYVMKEIYRQEVKFLWHKNCALENSDIIILPGGFSYGDYLRCGAIARFSPIMKEVVAFAKSGGTVIGICNGFQTLCEAGLLPGALLKNANLSFACKFVNVRVETNGTKFTSECSPGEILQIPIAHGEGNYFANDDTLDALEGHGQVLFRYSDRSGALTQSANPNGSSRNIAGIVNRAGNVMGMMPHPERASDAVLRHTDGQKIFTSLVKNLMPADTLYSSVG
jgi:phosphoribosylformylglycinamidine synthase subunit PurQ / glutaminase